MATLTERATGTARYTRIAILLHWIVAGLIVVNVALAWSWPHVADASVRPLIDNHKSIGITVLGLAGLRLLWRLGHRPPAMPPYAAWERGAAHGVHWLLYAVIFGMPLSGWIMDSAWRDAATHPMYFWHAFEWPRLGWIMALDPATRDRVHDAFGAAHAWLAYVLYALVFLHVAGAAKHQVQGERELQRMGWGHRADR